MPTVLDILMGDPLYAKVYRKNCVVDIHAEELMTSTYTDKTASFNTEAEGRAFALGWQLAMSYAGLPEPQVIEKTYTPKEHTK